MVAVANTIGFTQVHAEQQTDTPYGSWVAESFAEGDIVSNKKSILELHQDGSVSGSSGCNRFRGSFTFTKNAIQFSYISGTKTICTPALMNQEQSFYKALEDARSWELSSDILVLLDSHGSMTAKFVRQNETAAITINVPDALHVDRRRLSYNCEGTNVDVEYFNAGSTSLATLSLRGEFVVAANVVSASGARYAGKRLIWWTKGNNAHIYGLLDDNDEPVSCTPVEGKSAQ